MSSDNGEFINLRIAGSCRYLGTSDPGCLRDMVLNLRWKGRGPGDWSGDYWTRQRVAEVRV